MKAKPDAAAGEARSVLEQLIPAWSEQNRILDKVHTELVSIRGVHRDGAEARPLPAAGSFQVAFSAGRLMGHSIRETTGTGPAVVRIRDGRDAAGNIILTIALAAGESARDWLGPQGLGYVSGLYAEVAAGAVEGSVWVLP